MAWVCYSLAALLYLNALTAMTFAIWFMRKFINSTNLSQGRGVSIKIVMLHLMLEVLSATALLIFLTKTVEFMQPGYTCEQYVQMDLAMPKILVLFMAIEAGSQMLIFYTCFQYTRAFEQVFKSSKVHQTDQYELDASDVNIENEVEPGSILQNKDVLDYLDQQTGRDPELFGVLVHMFTDDPYDDFQQRM